MAGMGSSASLESDAAQENCKVVFWEPVGEPVILSAAKDLVGVQELALLPRRFFAALRMTFRQTMQFSWQDGRADQLFNLGVAPRLSE